MPAPIPVLLMARELNLGGTERQLTEMAKALDRSRFEPHVGSFHSAGLRANDLTAAGVPIAEFPIRSFASLSAFTAARALGRYLNRHHIQLVHTFDVPMNLFAAPVSRAYGVRSLLSSQRAYRTLTPGWRTHLLRATDRIVDGIVVNCRAIERHLIEDEKVPAHRIHLCYNGIDTQLFRPQRRDAGAPLTIGIVCALRPEKGLHTLMAAFAEVRRRHPAIRRLIAGDGPARPQLEKARRELGLGESCLLEPATTNVTGYLNTIDIFVMPSLSEALSNSLMEAMACGCAAVASGVGGNPELVEEGRTGFLFRSEDAACLAQKLRVLVENETLRKNLASAGARFVHDHFSIEKSARRMAEIYEEVLLRRNR